MRIAAHPGDEMMVEREDEREIPAGSMRVINRDLSVSLCLPASCKPHATRPPRRMCAAAAAAAGAAGDGAAPAHGHNCQDWEATDWTNYINRH